MTRNSKVLDDFIQYCINHPEQRFWQALRNWSGYSFILAVPVHTKEQARCVLMTGDKSLGWIDTFYWEGKTD